MEESEVKEEAECCDMTSMVEYLVRLIYEDNLFAPLNASTKKLCNVYYTLR